MTTHIHVHTTDDSERWITMTGSHVLVNGAGKVIAGAGGRLSSKSKTTAPRTQASEPKNQKTAAKNELSKSNKEALEAYTLAGSYPINDYLRNGTAVEKGKYSSGTPIRNSKDLKNNIAALDDAFSKASLQNDTTVYRGVDNEAWAKIVAQAKTGEVSDAGFMSTTTNKSSVTGSSLTHWMTIQVPKGSKAIPLDGEVKNRTKNEILLDKGSKFKVLKLTKNSCVLELL